MEEQTSAKIEDSEDNHFSNSLSGIDYQDSATLTEIESVYFYHDFYNVRTFEAPTIQKVPSIDYLIQDEYSNNTEIDETEISQIKTDQILKIFKPKITSYFSNDTAYKCTFMSNLSSYSETLGIDATLGYLIPLVKAITFEKKEVMCSFFNSIDSEISYLLKNNAYDCIISSIAPVIEEVLNEKKDENVQLSASQALISIIKIAKQEDIGGVILPMLISLCHNDTVLLRTKLLTIDICNKTASILGSDMLEAYVIPQLFYFSSDSNDNARLNVMTNLIGISEICTKECFEEKAFSIYKKFTTDTFFPIRKQSCELLPQITKIAYALKAENTYILCCDIYKAFCNDADSGIANNAIGIFGEFIYTVNKLITEEIKNELFDIYIKKFTRMIKGKNYEIDTTPINKAAFSFPSVVLVYGKEKWNSDLKNIFLQLASDKDYRIKKTISNSFAEIAKIVGTESAQTDIAPSILNYFDNNGFEIKNYIINKLPEFLSIINDESLKDKFIGCFVKISTERKQWRAKVQFAKTVGKLSLIYNDKILFDKLLPIIIPYCFDEVNQVKKKTCRYIGQIMLQILLHDNEELKEKCYNIITSFARCRHYHYRQYFFDFCLSIIKNKDVFLNKKILDLFKELIQDKIVNVRIKASFFLNKMYNKYDWIKEESNIKGIVNQLQKDKSKEVLENITEIEIAENINQTELIIKENVNELFTDELNIIKEYFNFTPIGLGNTNWLNRNNKV